MVSWESVTRICAQKLRWNRGTCEDFRERRGLLSRAHSTPASNSGLECNNRGKLSLSARWNKLRLGANLMMIRTIANSQWSLKRSFTYNSCAISLTFRQRFRVLLANSSTKLWFWSQSGNTLYSCIINSGKLFRRWCTLRDRRWLSSSLRQNCASCSKPSADTQCVKLKSLIIRP